MAAIPSSSSRHARRFSLKWLDKTPRRGRNEHVRRVYGPSAQERRELARCESYREGR